MIVDCIIHKHFKVSNCPNRSIIGILHLKANHRTGSSAHRKKHFGCVFIVSCSFKPPCSNCCT